VNDIHQTIVADPLAASLTEAISSCGCMSEFAKYVAERRSVKRWYIAADFCLGDTLKPNDVIAFTVIPEDAPLAALFKEISAVKTRDIKRVRRVPESMIKWLAEDHRFTFAFIVNRRSRRIFGGDVSAGLVIASARKAFEDFRHGPGDATLDAVISRWKALEQKAKAKNFNEALFNDALLVATIAALIGLLIAQNVEPAAIRWIPDRDDMTTAFGGAAFDVYARLLWVWTKPAAVRAPTAGYVRADTSHREDFYDGFNRIPDCVAGSLASCAYVDRVGKFAPAARKHQQMLGVIADNPRIRVFQMTLRHGEAPVVIPVLVSRAPIA